MFVDVFEKELKTIESHEWNVYNLFNVNNEMNFDPANWLVPVFTGAHFYLLVLIEENTFILDGLFGTRVELGNQFEYYFKMLANINRDPMEVKVSKQNWKQDNSWECGYLVLKHLRRIAAMAPG